MSNTTTTTRKPTKREMFEGLKRNHNLTPDEIAFIDHELELLARKNVTKDGEKKLTDRQKENKALEVIVAESMEENHLYTVSDLLKSVPGLPEDMSNQRLSRIVNTMVESGVLVKTTEKRKSYFQLA